MHKSKTVTENETQKFYDSEIQTDHLSPLRILDFVIIKKKELAVPVDQIFKIKESEKRDKYLDFARELGKLWNMRVAVILFVIGGFGIIHRSLGREREEMKIEG